MIGRPKSVGRWLARSTSFALVKALPVLARTGKLERGLSVLASIAQALPYEERHRLQLQQFKDALEFSHPVIQLARRIVMDAHPKFLRTFFGNLWLPWWENAQIRQEFAKREGFDPPQLAVISPLKQCNLQCVGCYANAVTNKDEILDFQTMDRIVEELKSFGVSFIVITGGEPTHPLIWSEIKALCAKHNDVAFMMYTN
ncbi:MAG: radical SAM protein, partial [Armatimonadota bacterium]